MDMKLNIKLAMLTNLEKIFLKYYILSSNFYYNKYFKNRKNIFSVEKNTYFTTNAGQKLNRSTPPTTKIFPLSQFSYKRLFVCLVMVYKVNEFFIIQNKVDNTTKF